MKKFTKALSLILVVALILVTLTACGTNGTYYLMIDGEPSTSEWISISGDTWLDSSDFSGACEINDSEIILYVSYLGVEMEFMAGEIDGNSLIFEYYGYELEFVK